jgi:hypothetical protein
MLDNICFDVFSKVRNKFNIDISYFGGMTMKRRLLKIAIALNIICFFGIFGVQPNLVVAATPTDQVYEGVGTVSGTNTVTLNGITYSANNGSIVAVGGCNNLSYNYDKTMIRPVTITNRAQDVVPTLVGPPKQISLSFKVNTPPAVAQPNAGMDILFQNATGTVTATVKDGRGHTVLAGTPIWFTESWTKLDANLTVDDTGDIDQSYSYKAVKSANFSTPIRWTNNKGEVESGFSSSHSGVYAIKAYAIKKQVDSNLLNRVNSDDPAFIGGMTQTAYETVKSNLIHDASNNPVVSGAYNVLCKTFVYYDRWYKVRVSNKRINCDGDVTSMVTFTGRDEDNKRVFQARTIKRIQNDITSKALLLAVERLKT